MLVYPDIVQVTFEGQGHVKVHEHGMKMLLVWSVRPRVKAV